MKSIQSRTYPNITPERMTAIRQQAQSRGLSMNPNVGDVSYDHCTVHYTYDPAANTLTLEPHVPFFVSEDEFYGHISDALSAINAPAPVAAAAAAATTEQPAAATSPVPKGTVYTITRKGETEPEADEYVLGDTPAPVLEPGDVLAATVGTATYTGSVSILGDEPQITWTKNAA